ncbi:MAG: ABC transporter permease [Nocardioidaceae bacterium]|nr:ABC transporter permease [Nocardioidaceae bacterium]
MTAPAPFPGGGGADDQQQPPPPRRSRTGYLLLLPGTLWLLLFFIVPLVTLVSTSLYDPAGTLETGYQLTFAFGNYVDAIDDYATEFTRSLLYGGLATLFALLLGYPLAYAIAFRAGRWKYVMLLLVIAPFFTSFLIRTLSWKMLLADQGVIVEVLRFLHILGDDGRLLATAPAVVLGLTYNFLPFMVLPLYASLDKIDVRLIEAAGDLYASPPQAFRRVTLPLSMPGVVAGTLLTFIPAAGDYINVELLGTPQQTMIGNRIQSLFGAGSYPAAAALSVTLMLLILAMVMLYIRRAGTDELL